MPSRGLSSRIALSSALDRIFAAGDAVAEAKENLYRARQALARAEEAVQRAVIRHNAEYAAHRALDLGLGGWGAN
jgi:hypothetical protein